MGGRRRRRSGCSCPQRSTTDGDRFAHAAQLGLVVGLGSATALGWEVAEYYTFIRHGTELDTAYTNTLGDMTLGTLGALVAGLVVLAVRRRRA